MVAILPIIHLITGLGIFIYYVAATLVQADISFVATSTDIWDNIELL